MNGTLAPCGCQGSFSGGEARICVPPYISSGRSEGARPGQGRAGQGRGRPVQCRPVQWKGRARQGSWEPGKGRMMYCTVYREVPEASQTVPEGEGYDQEAPRSGGSCKLGARLPGHATATVASSLLIFSVHSRFGSPCLQSQSVASSLTNDPEV
jgi:hypothetical protein